MKIEGAVPAMIAECPFNAFSYSPKAIRSAIGFQSYIAWVLFMLFEVGRSPVLLVFEYLIFSSYFGGRGSKAPGKLLMLPRSPGSYMVLIQVHTCWVVAPRSYRVWMLFMLFWGWCTFIHFGDRRGESPDVNTPGSYRRFIHFGVEGAKLRSYSVWMFFRLFVVEEAKPQSF